jgi:hypothetical protein
MITIRRKTYQVDLFEAGFPPVNVLIVHRQRGFIDRNLFQLWAEKVLFREIEQCVEYGSGGHQVVILNECTSHNSD